jgi:dihydrofolate synthase/folylpolyglutamate synthase
MNDFSGKKITVIFGALATKDVSAMARSLSTIASSFILTQSDVVGKPALEPAQLADILHEISPGKPLQIVEKPHEAIELALEQMDPGELLLITGSIYLIGEARSFWLPKKQILLELEKKEPILP